jgi:hypothetical protein
MINLGLKPPDKNEWKFSPEVSRDLLAKMIIVHEYPFRIVEHAIFQKFVGSLQPEFKMISQNTVRDDCLKIYNQFRNNIIEEIASIPRLALTTDLWTSNDQTGYMVVTAHYINSQWSLIKRIIGFKPLPSPHTGLAISERISQTLLEYNSFEKCTFVTLDNASANDLAIRQLKNLINERRPGGLDADGSYFHLRCAAHVINLVVKDGLQCILSSITKLRSSVKYVRGTPARKHLFEDAVRSCGITSDKHPAADVATRWNSTFLMIDSSLPYKPAFENLSMTDSSYDFCPNSEEWIELGTMRDFLGVFHKGGILSF